LRTISAFSASERIRSMNISTPLRSVAGSWPRAVTIAKMRPSRRILRKVLKEGGCFSTPSSRRSMAVRASARNLLSVRSAGSRNSTNAFSQSPCGGR